MRHRSLVTDETTRAVAQHGLFFAEDECHSGDSVQRTTFLDRHSGMARRTSSGLPGLRLDAPRNDGGISRAWQIKNPFRDDAEHHLAGAALDRVGLGAEPRTWLGTALRAFAFPFQRVDAASRHQDFVAALVQ